MVSQNSTVDLKIIVYILSTKLVHENRGLMEVFFFFYLGIPLSQMPHALIFYI